MAYAHFSNVSEVVVPQRMAERADQLASFMVSAFLHRLAEESRQHVQHHVDEYGASSLAVVQAGSDHVHDKFGLDESATELSDQLRSLLIDACKCALAVVREVASKLEQYLVELEGGSKSNATQTHNGATELVRNLSGFLPTSPVSKRTADATKTRAARTDVEAHDSALSERSSLLRSQPASYM